MLEPYLPNELAFPADVGLMVDAARDSGFPDELLATLLSLYDRASERGLGGADMSAVRAAFDR